MLAQVLGDPVDGVVGGDVERQRGAADLGRGLAERLARARSTSTHDHAGAVAGEHLGDGGADAARRAGHQRDLAVQRLVPVGGRRGVGRTDAEHLAVDVGRLGRTAGTAASTRARSRPAWRRGTGRPAPTVAPRRISLPSERVKPSSARCAIRSCDAARLLRRGADDDDAARRAEVAQQRREELVAGPSGLRAR